VTIREMFSGFKNSPPPQSLDDFWPLPRRETEEETARAKNSLI
jgi:hypothetical protein